jgi:arginine decarboxylase
VRPAIGLRLKLATRGSGRWKSSGGYRSKFGLTVSEARRVLERLRELGMPDCLELLHFHLGSQITNIRFIKAAVIEAARIYVEMARAGAGLKYLDVGGGLGVDYDGSQTDFESSVNYTLQEYANDVVYHIQNVCDEAGVAHPTIISESGRALVAYHSVLVFNVLGVSGLGEEELPPELPPDAEQPLVDLQETYNSSQREEPAGGFHDAQQALDQALNLFSLGYLPIEQRCLAESYLLGHLPTHPAPDARAGVSARGTGRPRRHALGHLLLQFLAVPEHARQLGDQASCSPSCLFIA